MLEARVALSSLRRAARDARFFRRRMRLVTDNMLTACILEKGRSRIPSLNALCKRAYAYQAAVQVQVRVRYLETDRNPADGPSRLMPIGWHELDRSRPAPLPPPPPQPQVREPPSTREPASRRCAFRIASP